MCLSPTHLDIWSPKTQREALQGGRTIKGYNNDVITTEAIKLAQS